MSQHGCAAHGVTHQNNQAGHAEERDIRLEGPLLMLDQNPVVIAGSTFHLRFTEPEPLAFINNDAGIPYQAQVDGDGYLVVVVPAGATPLTLRGDLQSQVRWTQVNGGDGLQYSLINLTTNEYLVRYMAYAQLETIAITSSFETRLEPGTHQLGVICQGLNTTASALFHEPGDGTLFFN